MADKSRELDPYDQPNVWSDVQPAVFAFAEGEESLETAELPENCLVYGHTPRIKTINAMKRRWAVREIGRLPEPGESLHIISNARFDFWDWVPAILEMAAPRMITQWYGSTWILNRRNATELLALHDAGKIASIGMITGIYFKRRESAVFATLYEGLKSRGQRFRAALNHSKWFALQLDDGTCLTVEASANFTENGNIEQYVYTNDPGLFQFYKSFADALLKHGDDTGTKPSAAKSTGPTPASQKRAGPGTWATTRDEADRDAIIAWKAATTPDPQAARTFAAAIVELIRAWCPTTNDAMFVTCPPQGASAPGPDCARQIARLVAESLALPFHDCLRRNDQKNRHGPWASRRQAPYTAEPPPPGRSIALVCDDLITSGTTMRLSLDALRQAGHVAFGFAYSGC